MKKNLVISTLTLGAFIVLCGGAFADITKFNRRMEVVRINHKLSSQELSVLFKDISEVLPKNTPLGPSKGIKSNVKVLDISGAGLSEIPENIGLDTSLEDINFSKNSLSELPETFSNLFKLRVVDLSYNKFSECPFDPNDFPNLEEINLKGNPIANEKIKALRKGSFKVTF